jgi:AcrR family transcriptional regulator
MLTLERKGADYHHGDLKHSAIRAARNLVERDGITSLGIRKVAELLAVSPAALYRHFENLEQMRAELREQIRQDLGEFMKFRRNRVKPTTNKRKNAILRFESLGEAYVDFARSNPRLFEVAFIHCDEKPISEFSDLAWDLLKESLTELMKVGFLDKKVLTSAPMIAWSSVHGLAVLVANRAIAQRDQEEALQQILDGVQRALRA